VLQAAREVDDAAVGFATNREQIPILEEAVKAAQRSLAIANLQYREGLANFERVLDSQRTLFNQQERLVNNQGNVAQSLVDAVQGDGRRLAAGARPAAGRRRDARNDGRAQRLAGPAGGATAAARRRPATDHTGEGRTMTEESPSHEPVDRTPAPKRRSRARRTGSARPSCWR
jgi:hypothetical protein